MSGNADDFEAAIKPSAADTVASFTERKGFLAKLQHALHVNPALVPLFVLLVSIILFALLLGSRFLSPFALTLILQQVQIVGIVAAAQSLVILTAGIDLSVGAIAVLSSVIMGQFTFRYGLPVEVSVALGLAFGTIIGSINGWLVAVMKLPPFIVTLGMWQIVLAANFLYSANETIRSQDIEQNAPLLQFLGSTFKIGADADGRGGATFTFGVIAMVLIFAGWALIGRIGSVSPTSGQLLNIESITAVVIGGISLFGGRGSIMGPLFGALIVGVFTLGLRLAGADAQWTFLLIGALIIGAVAVDQWIRKVSA